MAFETDNETPARWSGRSVDCLKEGTKKAWLASRRLERETVHRSKSVIVQVVILHDHQISIAQLGHEMEGFGIMKSADDRSPISSIGINRPDAPEALVAKSLAFKAAKHEATILQRRWM